MSVRLTSSILSRASQNTFSALSRLSQLRLQFPPPPPKRTMATSMPKSMKGVLIEKTGGVEVLQYKTDLPLPAVGEGQVLVKNDFIGINYIDTYVLLPHLFCASSTLPPIA